MSRPLVAWFASGGYSEWHIMLSKFDRIKKQMSSAFGVVKEDHLTDPQLQRPAPHERPTSALSSAAFHGDVKQIKQLIQLHNADPNEVIEHLDNPLLQAVGNHQFEAALTLLDNGADVNALNRHGVSALHRAISYNDAKIALLLLEYGAKVTEQAGLDEPLLHVAAWRGLTGVCQMLIAYGADPLIKDKWGNTALDRAENPSVKSDCLQIIQFAIEAQAMDPTPAQKSRPARGACLNILDADGSCILRRQVQSGNAANCRVLLECGADANIAVEDGMTILKSAIVVEPIDIALALIEYGADAGFGDPKTVSAFDFAAVVGQTSVCLALLDRSDNPPGSARILGMAKAADERGYSDCAHALRAWVAASTARAAMQHINPSKPASP